MLIFGEDENDTNFLAELIRGLCPNLGASIKPMRRPPILIRDASADDAPDRVDTIAALIDAERTSSEVICVFAHEDCDAVEPAHEDLQAKIEAAFTSRGYDVHGVAPAWECETWILQFPAATKAYRPSWNSLEFFAGKNVGLIQDAKETLRRQLRPKGRASNSVRDYRESDAPGIARKAVMLGLTRSPSAKSASYDAFVGVVDECCGKAS